MTPTWAFPVFFGFVWLFVLNLLSSIGGWRSLAQSYATGVSAQGQTFSFRSARLGSVNYGSCLRFVSGPAGLAIAVLFAFRPGHRPLFVPWSDVSVRLSKGWVFSYTDFYFAKHPGIRLRIHRGLGQQLLAAGGDVVSSSDTNRWNS